MPNFTVDYAVYGALPGGNSENAQAFNVTSELRSLLNEAGSTGVVACGNNLKGDPAPGYKKHFGAVVNSQYFACKEGQTIDFNHHGNEPRPLEIMVQFAVYGALDGGDESWALAYDVSAQLQFALDQGLRKVVCSNALFGDPDGGAQKHFAAVVIRDGKEYYYACQEGQTIDFTVGGGTQ